VDRRDGGRGVENRGREEERVAGDGHTDTVVKLGFWNKNAALELLCKHLGLLEQPDANDDRPTVPVYILPEGARVATR
jgi:hypothetical protein